MKTELTKGICSTILVLGLLLLAGSHAKAQDTFSGASWPQFRGPNVDGISAEQDVFPATGAFGLEIGWRTTIGEGISGVAIANGVVVTMAQSEEKMWVVALDAQTGDERWRYELAPAYYSPNGTYHGPFSTPLVTENAAVVLGRAGRLAALDLATGDLVWSIDLDGDLNATVKEHGFVTSPVLVDGTLIIQTGAENAAVGGFDPQTGAQLWTVGSDEVYYQTPALVHLNGRRQLVAAGQTNLMGIDPESGELLWQHAHNGDGFTGVQSMVPVAAEADRILLTNKHHSSALIEVGQDAGGIAATERWEQRALRNSFNVPVYYNGYIYGYSSRFLVCLDAETGEPMWRSRPPGDGWLILVDGHLVIVTKEGSLHVVKASPESYQEVGTMQLFDDPSWTHPSFAGGSIYARSYNELARVDIRSVVRLADAETPRPDAGLAAVGRFAQFLSEVAETDDKQAVVDRFIASIDQFPFVETDSVAHFIYRGLAEDLAIAGDFIGARLERPMTRVTGTDLFYYSVEFDPATRVNYHFIRDYEEITDPRNPRTTTTMIYGPDMEVLFVTEPTTVSWMSMPAWESPAHLNEPSAGRARGHLVTHGLDSALLGEELTLDVYVPAGYEESGTERYPVAYYHDGEGALARGQVPTSLDNLFGEEVRPLIAVFVRPQQQAIRYGGQYIESLASEVVPFIDSQYRTIDGPEGRASIGGGFFTIFSIVVALNEPTVFGKAAAQSVYFGPGFLSRVVTT